MDDLADACLFLMRQYDDATHINIGAGEDISIVELASLVRDIVYPTAQLVFDASKPDGSSRKLLDVSRIQSLGWRHATALREGITTSYEWFLENHATARGVAG